MMISINACSVKHRLCVLAALIGTVFAAGANTPPGSRPGTPRVTVVEEELNLDDTYGTNDPGRPVAAASDNWESLHDETTRKIAAKVEEYRNFPECLELVMSRKSIVREPSSGAEQLMEMISRIRNDDQIGNDNPKKLHVKKATKLIKSMRAGLKNVVNKQSLYKETFVAGLERTMREYPEDRDEAQNLMKESYIKSLKNIQDKMEKLPHLEIGNPNTQEITVELVTEIIKGLESFKELFTNMEKLTNQFVNRFKLFKDTHRKGISKATLGEIKEDVATYEKQNQPNDFKQLMSILKTYGPQTGSKGVLWDLCKEIYESVETTEQKEHEKILQRSQEKLQKEDRQETFCVHIRNTPKKASRIMAKGIFKYSDKKAIDVSRVVDTFGCEIMTVNLEDHISVLRRIKGIFGKGKKSTKHSDWEIRIVKMKLDFSEKQNEDDLGCAYADDKVIFEAKNTKTDECICIEAIILVQAIKNLKKASHAIYNIIRNAGELVSTELGVLATQIMVDMFDPDTTGTEKDKRSYSDPELRELQKPLSLENYTSYGKSPRGRRRSNELEAEDHKRLLRDAVEKTKRNHNKVKNLTMTNKGTRPDRIRVVNITKNTVVQLNQEYIYHSNDKNKKPLELELGELLRVVSVDKGNADVKVRVGESFYRIPIPLIYLDIAPPDVVTGEGNIIKGDVVQFKRDFKYPLINIQFKAAHNTNYEVQAVDEEGRAVLKKSGRMIPIEKDFLQLAGSNILTNSNVAGGISRGRRTSSTTGKSSSPRHGYGRWRS